jgi:hypothetical protein
MVAENFIFGTASRPTLESTQPPIKNSTGIHFHGVKRPPNDADEGGGPLVQITGTRRSERGTPGPTMLRMFLRFSTVDIRNKFFTPQPKSDCN